ncbi:MAG: ergothioneine biosynthesis protein EgtB [Xylophilus ampelinus]
MSHPSALPLPDLCIDASPASREAWIDRFRSVRAHTMALAYPLSDEDQSVQSMPDASPAKWHLAHTTWFFEAVLLRRLQPGYRAFDESFFFLFNSYYEALGPRHARHQRGVLTRPSASEVRRYRAHVDGAVDRFVGACDEGTWAEALPVLELGLHHEQQHQELLVTDILHAFSCNPLLPAYRQGARRGALRAHGEDGPRPPDGAAPDGADAVRWLAFEGGIVEIGHGAGAGGEAGRATGFAFDNETPRHRALLAPYRLADRLVTCGEYARFVADGGYREPRFWLSDGWAAVRSHGWTAPPYWLEPDDPRLALVPRPPAQGWQVFGIHGVQPMDPDAPVAQLSFYEAAAYAEWAGARLPTEFEWEAAASHPGMRELHGHAWQWTRSSYDPYPGFRPMQGVAAEYNGKFMVGQVVLRGSSVATPPGHARSTYRNFFPPAARWQFTGLRLAKDAA